MARTEFPSKATHAQTRAHNAALVLRALYDLGPISRAAIARLTGLTRTSVGELVAELEQEGLARDVGRGPSTGGKAPDPRRARRRRPPRRHPRPRRADLHRRAPRPPRRARAPRDPRPRRRATATPPSPLVHDLIDEILAGPHKPILGIGVGTPGIVDGERHDPLGGQPRLDRPAARPDPPATATASRRSSPTTPARPPSPRSSSRARTAAENLVAIKVGRGIGAGLVLDGELFGGDGDGAGEIGHIVVEPDGAQCHCGRFGCLETVASAPAILRAADGRGPRHGRQPRPTGRGRRAGRRDARSPSPAPPAGRSARPSRTSSASSTSASIVVHGTVTALGEPWLDGDPRRGHPPQPRPARPRDPDRRRRRRRGPDAPRRLRAAADRELGLTVHR